MGHSSNNTEASNWKLNYIKDDIYEIEMYGSNYGQKGWKIYLDDKLEEDSSYLTIQKNKASKW